MSIDTIQTSHTRFARALLRAALSSAGTMHFNTRIEAEPEEVTLWVPRRSHNDTRPPPKEPSHADPHQRLAQGLLGAVLGAAGMEAETHMINTEPHIVDMWFEPNPAQPRPAGLCGRIARTACVFKTFVKAPTERDLQLSPHDALKLAHRPDRDRKLPMVRTWIISNEVGPKEIDFMGLRAERSLPKGVYIGAPMIGMCALSLQELPTTRPTRIVRLLGTGSVLETAFTELAAMKKQTWERQVVHEALTEICAVEANVVPLADNPATRKCRRIYEMWYQRLVLDAA